MPYNKEDISRYAENDLSPEEKELFEAEMKKDPALAAEVSLYTEVAGTLQQRLQEDAGLKALKETMFSLNAGYFKAETAKVFSLKRYIPAMAVAAAAILFLVTLWPSSNYNDEYGGIEMVTSTERGDNSDTLLQKASVYFNKKQFKEALPLLEAAVKLDSSSQMTLFYRGVARQFTGANASGRADLEKVFNGESVFKYEAAFYIALGYAEEKNTSMAREWLKKIPAGTDVSEKAEKLLKKL